MNGVPACASKYLLKDVLRDEWGFNGYVISDEGAIEDILGNHKYTKSIPETAAAAVNAGAPMTFSVVCLCLISECGRSYSVPRATCVLKQKRA